MNKITKRKRKSTSVSAYQDKAASLRPFLLKSLISAVRLDCIVCLTHFYEVADPDNPCFNLHDALTYLSDLLSKRGWSVVKYNGGTLTETALSCPACTRLLKEPHQPPKRIANTDLTDIFK